MPVRLKFQSSPLIAEGRNPQHAEEGNIQIEFQSSPLIAEGRNPFTRNRRKPWEFQHALREPTLEPFPKSPLTFQSACAGLHIHELTRRADLPEN